MLPRHFFFQFKGAKLQALSINPSKTGLLQLCFPSNTAVPNRQKKTLFPKPGRNQRSQYDLEAEFPGRPKKKKPYASSSPPSSMPNMPFDQPFVTDTVGSFISDYIPLEKKDMALTPRGIKQRWEAFKMFLVSTYSLALIRRNSKSFKVRQFAEDAQKSFIAVNMSLQENDTHRLSELVVRSVYAALRQQFLDANQRIYWRFVKSVTRPRVVHARVAPVQEKTNLFAQVTVKMHTEQVLAITDIHGRKLKGDKKKSKEVVDYVVFEKHLAHPYGQWRVMGKLMPQQQIPASKLVRQGQAAQLARP